MKVYVAGSTQDILNIQWVQMIVQATGHTITHDWTKVLADNGGAANEVDLSPEVMQNAALLDMEGVYLADLVIAFGHPRVWGTLWELGAAVGRKPVWLVEWHRAGRMSVFEHMPGVVHVMQSEIWGKLWEHSEKRAMMANPLPINLNQMLADVHPDWTDQQIHDEIYRVSSDMIDKDEPSA